MHFRRSIRSEIAREKREASPGHASPQVRSVIRFGRWFLAADGYWPSVLQVRPEIEGVAAVHGGHEDGEAFFVAEDVEADELSGLRCNPEIPTCISTLSSRTWRSGERRMPRIPSRLSRAVEISLVRISYVILGNGRDFVTE